MKPKPGLDGTADQLRGLLDANPITRGMTIRVDRGQIYLGRQEPPGPFSDDEPDDRLRLSPIGSGAKFGLSVKRHTGKWDKTPFSGTPAELVDLVCAHMQHLVADLFSPPPS